MPQHFSFKIQIASIVLIMLIILTAIGGFTYFRLTYIVNNIAEAVKPDDKVMLLKQIHTELSDEESNVKSYILTGNNNYLLPFYYSASLIEEKLSTLQRIRLEEPEQETLVDSIRHLIIKKYAILNELLSLNNDEQITNELKKITNKITEAEKEQKLQTDTLQNIAKENNNPEKRKNIFSFFFEKKKRATVPAKKTQIQETINIKPAEIKQEIKNVKHGQTRKLLESKKQEFNLVMKNKEIMDNISSLIKQVEKHEIQHLEEKTKESKSLAGETKILIAAFCIAAIIMLVIASLLIAIYIKNNNKYREALQKAKTDAENITKAEEQFLAKMSHEIRTPMNAIVGFTDLILNTELTTEQKQYINAVKTSGENLLVIINDILDFSKIQSGKFSFEHIGFRLSQVITTLIELMLPKSIEKNIRLSSTIDKNIPDHLIGDPTRLSQILLNLVGNAIKFTNKGEIRIVVCLESEVDDMEKLKFSVIDTGIGIPAYKLSLIFEGFVQESNETNRKYGGTGLGLTIVKQLVEMQDGTVSVESEVNKGSIFSFDLNFKKNTSPDFETDTAEEQYDKEDLEGLNVLLVEDNLLNQILAKKILTDWKLNVEVAENGVIATEKLEKNNFDLILMDIQMPEMDGYETTHHIRKKFSFPKSEIPIIAMTAHALSGEAEKCSSAGMNDYISKPFDQKVLYTKIVSVLKKFNTSQHGNKRQQTH